MWRGKDELLHCCSEPNCSPPASQVTSGAALQFLQLTSKSLGREEIHCPIQDLDFQSASSSLCSKVTYLKLRHKDNYAKKQRCEKCDTWGGQGRWGGVVPGNQLWGLNSPVICIPLASLLDEILSLNLPKEATHQSQAGVLWVHFHSSGEISVTNVKGVSKHPDSTFWEGEKGAQALRCGIR